MTVTEYHISYKLYPVCEGMEAKIRNQSGSSRSHSRASTQRDPKFTTNSCLPVSIKIAIR